MYFTLMKIINSVHNIELINACKIKILLENLSASIQRRATEVTGRVRSGHGRVM